MSNILITGGTGLIGSHLVKSLINGGQDVAVLSRRSGQIKELKVFNWDPNQSYIDPQSVLWADHIIHLAGEPVARGRWTSKRKKDILESRISSTKLLTATLMQEKHNVSSLVSASAIGAYGSGIGFEPLVEESEFGEDFLAEVVKQWESETQKVGELGVRAVNIRVGVVLSTAGGALAKMAAPISYGVGAPLGSGTQMMSWIHIDDLANIFIKAIKDSDMVGAYNAVAPDPVDNAAFTRLLARKLQRPLFLPNIPEFMMRLMLGEMSDLVLGGKAVSASKLIDSGSIFLYPQLDMALDELYNHR